MRNIILVTGILQTTKHDIFYEIDFIQTNKRKDNLVLLAKAWAIEFPCLRVWEKEWILRKLAIDTMSLTIWPMADNGGSPTMMAFLYHLWVSCKILLEDAKFDNKLNNQSCY